MLEEFFTVEGTLVAWKDVDGLFKALNMSQCSGERRLFIDSSKVSLKAVLLHNGNVLPSIPVAHQFGIKESDVSMKQLLQYMQWTHTSRKFVRTWKSLHVCLDCRSGTLNFLVFCVSGTAEARHFIVKRIWPLREFSSGLLSGELWFCEWRARRTFPPGHCSNGGRYKG